MKRSDPEAQKNHVQTESELHSVRRIEVFSFFYNSGSAVRLPLTRSVHVIVSIVTFGPILRSFFSNRTPESALFLSYMRWPYCSDKLQRSEIRFAFPLRPICACNTLNNSETGPNWFIPRSGLYVVSFQHSRNLYFPRPIHRSVKA